MGFNSRSWLILLLEFVAILWSTNNEYMIRLCHLVQTSTHIDLHFARNLWTPVLRIPIHTYLYITCISHMGYGYSRTGALWPKYIYGYVCTTDTRRRCININATAWSRFRMVDSEVRYKNMYVLFVCDMSETTWVYLYRVVVRDIYLCVDAECFDWWRNIYICVGLDMFWYRRNDYNATVGVFHLWHLWQAFGIAFVLRALSLYIQIWMLNEIVPSVKLTLIDINDRECLNIGIYLLHNCFFLLSRKYSEFDVIL